MSKIIIPYKGIHPKIHDSVFVAGNAAITGDVEIGEQSSIWFSVTLRGDVNPIRIGKRTNIQDGAVVHTTSGFQGTTIGDDVTVGHCAILHACTIEDMGFVGMQALVMDGAVVQSGGMLAAGALLPPGKIVPKGEIWAGRPARLLRKMTQAEIDYLPWSAKHYVEVSRNYL